MTVRLRAHHLLCMLTYVGKGYTPGFTVNYDRVAERLNRGEEIEIVSGPDDICAPLLPDQTAHCFNESVLVRDAKALETVSLLVGKVLVIGSRVVPDEAHIRTLRAGFASDDRRAACSGCEWSNLCDRVSATDFSGAKVAPPQPADITA